MHQDAEEPKEVLISSQAEETHQAAAALITSHDQEDIEHAPDGQLEVHQDAEEPKEVLISSQAEETHQVAAAVITSDEQEDIQHAPDRQVKIAETIEYIGTDYQPTGDLSKLETTP